MRGEATMGIAVTRIGAGPLSVRCRICGRASPRGAKLCDQCVAAVKGARQVRTITSEFLPQSGPAGAASPKVAAQRSSRRRRAQRWSWLPAKPDEWIALIAFGLFGAAVGAAGYLAIEEIAEGVLAVGMPTETDPAALRVGSPAATDPAATHASVAPSAETASADRAPKDVEPVSMPVSDAAPIIAEPIPPTLVHEKPAPQPPASGNRLASGSPARAPQTSSARAGDAEGMVAPDAGAQPPPVQLIASAAIARESPASDRWETMGAALTTCSSESFLGGVVCAERVRLQYCEGFWGEVPQCRAAARPGASR